MKLLWIWISSSLPSRAMSFFLDCCNGNDLGPELTYRAPIDALTPLELEIITASYIGSRVVDLNKVGSKFGDRTLMDLGAVIDVPTTAALLRA